MGSQQMEAQRGEVSHSKDTQLKATSPAHSWVLHPYYHDTVHPLYSIL